MPGIKGADKKQNAQINEKDVTHSYSKKEPTDIKNRICII
jgi:hypothetical protein